MEPIGSRDAAESHRLEGDENVIGLLLRWSACCEGDVHLAIFDFLKYQTDFCMEVGISTFTGAELWVTDRDDAVRQEDYVRYANMKACSSQAYICHRPNGGTPMARFIFSQRNGIHIIDLQKTRRASSRRTTRESGRQRQDGS